MGIPYSKEINRAFDELGKAYGQITPLVAAAYDVLESTKNISLLLAGIQVLTVILLALILLALVGMLITLNPDLEEDRAQFVTPVVHWLAGWADVGKVSVGASMGFGLLICGAAGVVYVTSRKKKEDLMVDAGPEGEDGNGNGDGKGADDE